MGAEEGPMSGEPVYSKDGGVTAGLSEPDEGSATYWEAQIDALRAENERLREALKALVQRIGEIANDPDFKTMQTVYCTHGFRYGGPSWAEPLKAAQAVLSEAIS
jgi:hypothetical protein